MLHIIWPVTFGFLPMVDSSLIASFLLDLLVDTQLLEFDTRNGLDDICSC